MSSTRLTPFSRLLIALAIAGGVFYVAKTILGKNNSGNDNSTATATGSPSGVQALLNVSGSSTLGAAMIPQIAKDFMTNELSAKDVTIQKIDDTNTEVVGTMPDGSQKMIGITTGGSLQGINDIKAQKADIALFSGNEDALDSGLELSVISLDGIAIIVNSSNKIQELTKTQIAAIFSGKINNWSQVGGQPAPITCFGRDANSGTSEAFKQLVFNNTNTALPTTVTAIDNSKKLVSSVENDPNSIGFVSFSSIGNTRALGISDIGTTVRYPSVFTIQTEDYLLTRRLCLATLPNKANEYIVRFLNYCKEDNKGQKIVASTGFVSMDLHNASTQTAIKDAPPAYISATEGAKRLPTTLHFQSGSSLPDTRAKEDLKRIMQILSDPSNRKKSIVLIGFTDNVGEPTKNITLSVQRAQSMQSEFAKFGVKTEIFGFGQALPIAENATPIGQNKNRRVEVWLE